MFELLNSDDCNASGSTANCIGNKVFTVGGYPGQQLTTTRPFLQVDCLDLETKSWVPIYSNTNEILNRAFHCSCVFDDEIFIFGGCIAGSEASYQNSNQILRIKDTELGVISTVQCLDENTSRQGQSACLMGRAKKCVILYGGFSYGKDTAQTKSSSRVYQSNVWSFSNASGDFAFNQIDVATDDEVPTERAFHTAVVCGDDNEFMIMCGGQNGETLLNDIWMLDMTAILMPDASLVSSLSQKKIEVKKAPAASKKGAVQITTPCARWTKLKIPETSVFAPRQLHSSYFLPLAGSNSQGRFCIFGGLGEYGPLDSTVAQWQLSIVDWVPILSEVPILSSEAMDISSDFIVDAPETVYGAATTLFTGNSHHNFNTDSTVPRALLVLGGNYQFQGETLRNGCKMIIFEEENNILMKDIVRATMNISRCASLDNNDTVNEEEEAKPTDNMIYVGDTKGSQRHGNGRLSDGPKLVYEGQFRFGEYHGEGKLMSENGDIYEGEFSEGLKDGFGVLTKETGVIYKGDWCADKMMDGNYVTSYIIQKKPSSPRDLSFQPSDISDDEAKRREYSGSSGLYDGHIVNLVPHDMDGVCRYADGGEYRGSWRSGRRNGHGTYTSVKGDAYQGKWVADERSGKGLWTCVTGGSYEGLWDCDLPHGRGIRKYSDKSNYTGNFCNGKRSGMGTMVYPDGSVYAGVWENDCRNDEQQE